MHRAYHPSRWSLLFLEADSSKVSIPRSDVVVPQLAYLILEVELRLHQVPFVLATFERIRQSHLLPAPI
jgi:hypothetical protein